MWLQQHKTTKKKIISSVYDTCRTRFALECDDYLSCCAICWVIGCRQSVAWKGERKSAHISAPENRNKVPTHQRKQNNWSEVKTQKYNYFINVAYLIAQLKNYETSNYYWTLMWNISMQFTVAPFNYEEAFSTSSGLLPQLNLFFLSFKTQTSILRV